MYDDVTQRNAAGELEIRTVSTTGDTSKDKNDVFTRDNQGRLALRTTGTGGGGGGGGASSAADLSVNPAGLKIITSTNAQSALEELDAAVATTENAISILQTEVELTESVGGATTVDLNDLVAMDIDGRPSHKAPGATVYGPDGAVGVISTVTTTEATVITVSVPPVVLELTTED